MSAMVAVSYVCLCLDVIIAAHVGIGTRKASENKLLGRSEFSTADSARAQNTGIWMLAALKASHARRM